MQVLHVARYYGCDQLVALSERRLVLMLLRAEEQNAAHELVPTPHKLETAPHELTPAPHELAPTPHNLESAPHELASAPQELAPQLLAIALNEGLARLEQAALDYVSAWSGCMWRAAWGNIACSGSEAWRLLPLFQFRSPP